MLTQEFRRLHEGLILFSCLGILASCNERQPPSAEQLAKKTCSTCHTMVDPALLDKGTWKNSVLPNMASRIGMHHVRAGSSPAITAAQWSAIEKYYVDSAPEHLAAAPSHPLLRDWWGFSLKKPAVTARTAALTTLVAFDEQAGDIFTGDAGTFRLTRWNKALIPVDSLPAGSPPVNAWFEDGLATFTTLGTMKANDVAEGKVMQMAMPGKLRFADTVASSLPRPVQAVPADINKDGLSDWIVCGFGHDLGGLYWYQQDGHGKYIKHTILNMPGSLQVITGDFNADGWIDLMALFGAADECIRLFLNDHHGGFTSKKLLSFPAVYGSGSFQLADMNGDGLKDILYTCGDNNDYSTILKPYHGVYVYVNAGNDVYQEKYFYPINGCTKAVAADFDLDGDADIAAIAFYADLDNKPAEKFIFLEQSAPLRFTAHSPPIENYGRWICMDVKDYDHDGDADIVLGNFSATFKSEKMPASVSDQRLPFIVLVNNKIRNNK